MVRKTRVRNQHNFSTIDEEPKMLKAQHKGRQPVKSTAFMKSGEDRSLVLNRRNV